MTESASESAEKFRFTEAMREALGAQSFVRVTLGKYRGHGADAKITVSRVEIKGKDKLKFVRSEARRDTTENFDVADGIVRLTSLIGADFLSATLFSTAGDTTLTYSKKRVPHLSSGKATFAAVPAAEHDRAKAYIVPPTRPYLKVLGVSDGAGRIKPTMFGKFKQIERFVEILDALIQHSELAARKSFSVLDVGAGKGYLTFALYDHLRYTLGLDVRVTGIEVRPELAADGNRRARESGYDKLQFVAGEAQALQQGADIIIALHACDTATDDAMALGIKNHSAMIVTAPCCQHELAPQLGTASGALGRIAKFPLLRQRQADLVTDTARALLLEASGYRVTVSEFVASEHTAKNILIAAVAAQNVDRDAALKAYDALKKEAGFSTQALEVQLKDAL